MKSASDSSSPGVAASFNSSDANRLGDMEDFDLMRYIYMALAWWWIILLSVLLGVVGGLGL